jgi:hypothetical protein
MEYDMSSKEVRTFKGSDGVKREQTTTTDSKGNYTQRTVKVEPVAYGLLGNYRTSESVKKGKTK